MSHAKPWAVGGVGAAPSLDDVVSVARGHLVALDGAAAERVKKESPPPKLFEPEDAPPPQAPQGPAGPGAIGSTAAPQPVATTAPPTPAAAAAQPAAAPQPAGQWPAHLSKEQARAAIVTRLLSIMNGRSGVRLQLADFLKELLNHDVVPALPAADDHTALSALADACKGLGSVAGSSSSPAAAAGAAAGAAADGGSPPAAGADGSEPQQDQQQVSFAAALEAAGLKAPGISAGERCVLTSGAAASAGVGALVIVAARQVLSSVTAVAALSCEAAGAHAKSFEPDVVESQGYQGAIAAADELRSLLEGSRAVGSRAPGSKKGMTNEQQAAFSNLPQELGAVSDALAHAYSAVRPEVQSAALVALCLWKCGSVGGANPILAPALADAAHALLSLANSSLSRVQVIGKVACPAAAPALQQLADAVAAGPVATAQQQLAEAGALLLGPTGTTGPAATQSVELRASLAAAAALAAVQRAVAVEGLAAVVALRLQEGNPPPPPLGDPLADAAAAAARAESRERDYKEFKDSREYELYKEYKKSREYKEYREYKEAKEREKKKDAKKKDKKGAGLGLGRGSAIVRSHLEAAVAQAAAASEEAATRDAIAAAQAQMAAASLADGSSSSGQQPDAGGEIQPLDEQTAALAAAAAAAEEELAAAAALPPATSLEVLEGPPAVLEAARFVLQGVQGVDAAEGLVAAGVPAAGRLLEEVRVVIEANQARRKPKVAKGARDFLPEQMAIREAAFASITAVFKRHGAVSIDTPVFELRETLMGKYGEDSKLIYDLADQGGEMLSLRYDLTVPFARYVAVNGVGNIKRYHIGKVYRRDQPQLNRGRFREFFQCDFDIAGSYAPMVADAEVLKVLVEILSDLKLGKFTVKLNHRRLLDAMLSIAGVPAQKFRPICSAIDKLDKEPWDVVRAEMVEEKGLPGEVADTIGQFVVLRGQPRQMLALLQHPDHPLAINEESAAALEELSTLFDYLEAFNALGPISFDLSLARGLDYYTGVIYEAVLEGGNVGSIAAGGRYDKLVGMFSGKDVPAVGVSIGIERVFAIMEAQARAAAEKSGKPIRATETQVLVASIGNGMQVKRMELAAKLWAAGIKAEFGFKPNPKMGDQLNHALEAGIPFMVLFGETELSNGVVKVKLMAAKREETVALDVLVEELQKLLKPRGEDDDDEVVEAKKK